jgi:hypothetical protein
VAGPPPQPNSFRDLVLIVSTAISFFLIAVMLQILARSTNNTLPAFRAYIIVLILIAVDFLVVSPIVSLLLGEFSNSN